MANSMYGTVIVISEDDDFKSVICLGHPCTGTS